MINALTIFRQLSDFYWGNLDNQNPSVQHFCLVYSKLIGGSSDSGDLNNLAAEDFEQFVADFDNIEESFQDDFDAVEKTLKKACKAFGFEPTFHHLDSLNYLAGMLDLIKEVEAQND